MNLLATIDKPETFASAPHGHDTYRTRVSPVPPSPPGLLEGGYMLLPASLATYESLLADKDDATVPRIAYFDGTLEIRMPHAEHEQMHRIAAALVTLLLIAWEIDANDLGGMTHRPENVNKGGFEPDTCFVITGEDETPLLAVESDLTSPSWHKLPLYAAWGYRELWRFALTTEGAVILTLYVLDNTGDSYAEAESSAILAPLTRAEVAAFVQARVDGEPLSKWGRRVTEWARAARPAP